MFDSPLKLLLGLLTGIVFGFLVQKGRATKYEVIVDQFRLRDWTVVKIMGTAVVVGSVGVAALAAAGMTTLSIKPMLVGGVVVGGILFGSGVALLGYCPGTSIAAAGEGRRDAMVGILGMFAGAVGFVAAYPLLKPVIEGLGDAGKVTLPQITHTSPWLWVGALVLAGVVAALLQHRQRVVRRVHGRTRSTRHAHASP
jgi:uncharacterized membrane protein YedE/YeeE